MSITADRQVWLITGCSSGLGRALAAAALDASHYVVATARNVEQIGTLDRAPSAHLCPVSMDITSEQSVERAIDAALDRFGRIDVVVNNAGRGLIGAVEECSLGEIRQLYETNVFGTVQVTQAVLPILREQRSGHIVFLSSIGAFAGAPGAGIYGSSKAAIDALADVLRAELAPFHIRVSTVLPGLFRTDFRQRSMAYSQGVIDDYPAGTRQRASGADLYPPHAGDPSQAAKLILTLVGMANPPARLALGADAMELMQKKLNTLQAEMDTVSGSALDYRCIERP